MDNKRPDLAQRAVQVNVLSTAEKFRVAARLVDAGKPTIARTIGKLACDEIQLAAILKAT